MGNFRERRNVGLAHKAKEAVESSPHSCHVICGSDAVGDPSCRAQVGRRGDPSPERLGCEPLKSRPMGGFCFGSGSRSTLKKHFCVLFAFRNQTRERATNLASCINRDSAGAALTTAFKASGRPSLTVALPMIVALMVKPAPRIATISRDRRPDGHNEFRANSVIGRLGCPTGAAV